MKQGEGAHLTKPDWSKPHTHYKPYVALFRHKITLYRFNQGELILLQGGLKWEQGAESPVAPITLTTGHNYCEMSTAFVNILRSFIVILILFMTPQTAIVYSRDQLLTLQIHAVLLSHGQCSVISQLRLRRRGCRA